MVNTFFLYLNVPTVKTIISTVKIRIPTILLNIFQKTDINFMSSKIRGHFCEEVLVYNYLQKLEWLEIELR